MNPYDDLSEDNFIAFMQLEREFRLHFETETEQGNNWDWYAPDYMNKVLAAAKQFEIDALSNYAVPYGSKLDYEIFSTFLRDVDHVIVQMRIMHSRRVGRLKVGLSQEQKTRLHGYVARMRREIEKSLASDQKKDAILDILTKLDAEISKDRTAYDRFADLARNLAGLSREVAEEGAEPWWKWFKLAAGVVDEAKDQEPKLPPTKDVKQISAPRKQLPKPSENSGYGNGGGRRTDLDDEIPF